LYLLTTFVMRWLSTSLFLVFFSGASAQQWRELNPPDVFFNNNIWALTVDKTGKVYAAGNFTDSSGNKSVAVLAGGAWTDPGGPPLQANGTIYALTVDSSGNLFAGGAFTDAAGNYYVAKWDGSQWSEPGSGAPKLFTGRAFALAADKGGNIYAGGEMFDSAGSYYVIRWDGQAWTEVGTGSQALHANSIIYSVTCDAAGNIYTAGQFTDSAGYFYVAKWNGSSWSELGNGSAALKAGSYITSLTVDGAGNLYAAGDFKDSAGYQYVAKWDGSGWTELGTGASALRASGTINSIVFDGTGMLDATGFFLDPAGFYSIERWSGAVWSEVPVTAGVWPANNDILALAADRSGNLFAAGNFEDAGSYYYVAELSGGSWAETGKDVLTYQPAQTTVQATAVDTAGRVYATYASGGGEYWNGSGWFSLPASAFLTNANISQLVPDSSGNVYAYGVFSGAPGVAKWDGSNWTLIPNPGGLLTINSITCLAVDKKGNVYLSGNFTENGALFTLVKWNGNSWQTYPYANAQGIYYFIVDSAGTIYAAYSDISFDTYNLMRITADGSTYLNGGLQKYQENYNTLIHSMTFDAAGNLYIGGEFTDTTGTVYVARWDGNSWAKVGTSIPGLNGWGSINELVFDNAGNLYASGHLTDGTVDFIEKWDGHSWTNIANENNVGFFLVGDVYLLEHDARGNIYAGGGFTGSRGLGNYIYEYNGSNQPLPVVCQGVVSVGLSANPDTVTAAGGGPFIVTASVTGGEGTATSFTFSTNRDFNPVLQAASADSVVSVPVSDLPAVGGTVYVKVQTTDACDSVITGLDSIAVVHSVVSTTGGVDSAIIAGPNPFDQFINVQGLNPAESYSIYLYDGQGARVWSLLVTGQTVARMTGPAVKQGIYWLEVVDNSSGKRVDRMTMFKGR
jgi:hypothetical protein